MEVDQSWWEDKKNLKQTNPEKKLLQAPKDSRQQQKFAFHLYNDL